MHYEDILKSHKQMIEKAHRKSSKPTFYSPSDD